MGKKKSTPPVEVEAAEEMVSVDLPTTIRVDGESYGPGRDVLVPMRILPTLAGVIGSVYQEVA